MDISTTSVLVIAPVSAVLLHETVLKHVEVDHLTLPFVTITTAVFWLTVYYSTFLFGVLVAAAFFLPLCTKIILYRAFFHQLKHFPGPFGARISKVWTIAQVMKSDMRYYQVQAKFQKQYGDYVRVGPRELAIFDPAAIQPLLGFKSPTTKGPFYDLLTKSLHLSRDKAFHRQRRKIWDNAMKDSLSDYAPRVEDFTSQLLTRLREADGEPVQLLNYCVYYAYDVMSALAFGKPMGLVNGGSNEYAESILHTMTDGLDAMGYVYHVPWFANAVGVLMHLGGPLKVWADWSQQQMEERMAAKDPQPDLSMHLIANTPRNPEGDALLYGDSRLIITAGSETISTALTFIFIHLALHPRYMRGIREEYRDAKSSYSCERPAPLLDSIVWESMRIWPSVLVGGQRVSPPEGFTINGHYIPGNTLMSLPPFAMNRDARSFERPDEFIPERWTTRPELVLNQNAFIPFSTGPYSCVGKGLAMMELRSVVSRVINEFDVVLPEEFDSEKYFGNIKEHFTTGPPDDQTVRFVKAA
ncbi:cytochrome P450 [Byssothecium circinans]|uniref:Cytochrome P450 n=1 Tax=Byssothecium circinans TaxID=147558 RepID=A0A6A5U783_9PLEO|nr:cytochrome P450 [Byssothecium circinans]